MKVKTDHRRAKQRQYNAKYRAANRDRLRDADAIYREQHRDEIRAKQRHDRSVNRNKWRKIWRSDKRKRIRTDKRREWERLYRARRRINCPKEKLSNALRARIRDAVGGKCKAGSAVRDLGCTPDQLVEHIESLWKPGMSWNNYGYRGWHIDHIRPLALFDLTNREQFLIAAHYTNLQPLWAEENLTKGKKENRND